MDMESDDEMENDVSCNMEGQTPEGETIYMEMTDLTSDLSTSSEPGSCEVPEVGFEYLNFGRIQIEAHRANRLKIAPITQEWTPDFFKRVLKLIEQSENVNAFWTMLHQNNLTHIVNSDLANDLYQVVKFGKRVTSELSVPEFGGDHHGSKQRIIKATQKVAEIDHEKIFKRDNELRQKVIVRLPLASKAKLATFVEAMTILSLMVPINGIALRNIQKGHQSKGCTIFIWTDKKHLDRATKYLKGIGQKPKITKH
jgi:hypothetical protein